MAQRMTPDYCNYFVERLILKFFTELVQSCHRHMLSRDLIEAYAQWMHCAYAIIEERQPYIQENRLKHWAKERQSRLMHADWNQVPPEGETEDYFHSGYMSSTNYDTESREFVAFLLWMGGPHTEPMDRRYPLDTELILRGLWREYHSFIEPENDGIPTRENPPLLNLVYLSATQIYMREYNGSKRRAEYFIRHVNRYSAYTTRVTGQSDAESDQIVSGLPRDSSVISISSTPEPFYSEPTFCNTPTMNQVTTTQQALGRLTRLTREGIVDLTATQRQELIDEANAVLQSVDEVHERTKSMRMATTAMLVEDLGLLDKKNELVQKIMKQPAWGSYKKEQSTRHRHVQNLTAWGDDAKALLGGVEPGEELDVDQWYRRLEILQTASFNVISRLSDLSRKLSYTDARLLYAEALTRAGLQIRNRAYHSLSTGALDMAKKKANEVLNPEEQMLLHEWLLKEGVQNFDSVVDAKWLLKQQYAIEGRVAADRNVTEVQPTSDQPDSTPTQEEHSVIPEETSISLPEEQAEEVVVQDEVPPPSVDNSAPQCSPADGLVTTTTDTNITPVVEKRKADNVMASSPAPRKKKFKSKELIEETDDEETMGQAVCQLSPAAKGVQRLIAEALKAVRVGNLSAGYHSCHCKQIDVDLTEIFRLVKVDDQKACVQMLKDGDFVPTLNSCCYRCLVSVGTRLGIQFRAMKEEPLRAIIVSITHGVKKQGFEFLESLMKDPVAHSMFRLHVKEDATDIRKRDGLRFKPTPQGVLSDTVMLTKVADKFITSHMEQFGQIILSPSNLLSLHWASSLFELMIEEAECYAYHQQCYNNADNFGWNRLQYYSVGQTMLRSDPGHLIAQVLARPDHEHCLVAYPYYTRFAQSHDKAEFYHIDVDPAKYLSGKFNSMVQSSHSITDEKESNCFRIVLGFHQHMAKWWKDLTEMGKSKVHDVMRINSENYGTAMQEKYGKWTDTPVQAGGLRLTLTALPHGASGGDVSSSTKMTGVKKNAPKNVRLNYIHFFVLSTGSAFENGDVPEDSLDVEQPPLHVLMKKSPSHTAMGVPQRYIPDCTDPFNVDTIPPTALGKAIHGLLSYDSAPVQMSIKRLLATSSVETKQEIDEQRRVLIEWGTQKFAELRKAEKLLFGDDSFYKKKDDGIEIDYARPTLGTEFVTRLHEVAQSQ